MYIYIFIRKSLNISRHGNINPVAEKSWKTIASLRKKPKCLLRSVVSYPVVPFFPPFFPHSIYHLFAVLFSLLSLLCLVVTQIYPWWHSRLFSPSIHLLGGSCLAFFRENISALSSGRLASNCSAVHPFFISQSHRPIVSFIRIKHRTRANDNLCKCLMYHAACKVEFQPFTRSYSQLTFFNFL